MSAFGVNTAKLSDDLATNQWRHPRRAIPVHTTR